ncbi:hypothetical protein L1987_25493 [Smallanthus sonchifolius]|uniref:Uncharacterized protein n=1 Tax=Smallanthus sonchifolius TaxID=185202 RepID=A0ACB9IPV2_9ASTR|nr:hypothetical protein L1987_25493 [Smallanthus sonchifolius]
MRVAFHSFIFFVHVRYITYIHTYIFLSLYVHSAIPLSLSLSLSLKQLFLLLDLQLNSLQFIALILGFLLFALSYWWILL